MPNVFTLRPLAVAAMLMTVSGRAQDNLAKPANTPAAPTTSFSQAAADRGFGFGIARYATPTVALPTFHGLFRLADRQQLGLGFGFANDGDTVLLVADYRRILVQTDGAGIFTEGTLGFLQAAADYFYVAARVGFIYPLTAHLVVDFAWGLEYLNADGASISAFTPSPDFAGKFGMHWFF